MVDNFMILSERCTGSHFLQYAMTENFHIKYLNNHHKQKHFFGHDNDNYSPKEIESSIIFCLVRNPIDWIDSFFKKSHHVPNENKTSIESFVNNEWYSVYEEGENKGKEIMDDRNIYTKERYKNLFELRKTKNEYFLNTIQNKFKHFMILKYEDLRDNYMKTMDKIRIKFNLTTTNTVYKEIVKYKGSYNALYTKKPILLTSEMQDYIKKNVDIEQEKKLGYNLDV
jgi:hypothetical protein